MIEDMITFLEMDPKVYLGVQMSFEGLKPND